MLENRAKSGKKLEIFFVLLSLVKKLKSKRSREIAHLDRCRREIFFPFNKSRIHRIELTAFFRMTQDLVCFLNTLEERIIVGIDARKLQGIGGRCSGGHLFIGVVLENLFAIFIS